MTFESTQRRLAAILSADVAGYSRLMAADEEATVRTLTAYREQIGALVREHRGRVVDAPGDNLLAEFSTATDAVEAAVEIQRVIAARNAALDGEHRMRFRIGVHLGEVRVEGDRIYGDGVNIAARLEGLAEAGGICVSAAVRDQVARRLALDFEDLGEQSVKNLPDPVRVYRVLERAASTAGSVAASDRSTGATHARRRIARPAVVAAAVAVVALAIAALVYRDASSNRSPADGAPTSSTAGPPLTAIAVLPFDDLSPGGDHAWLANGMAEELIEMLSRTETLQVVARTSAHVAKEKGADIATIGKLLNVGSVVEGSVRRAGEQLRVTVQLIRVADGYHLWSGRYDRELDDVFAIQEEIGREVTEALRDELGVVADTHSWLKRARYLPRDVRAYELLKKGVDLSLLSFKEESVRQAIDLYLQALEIDPDYAEAHAGLAWANYYLWALRFDPPEQALSRAKAAGQRALELEPTNGSAHNLMGSLSLDRGDWEDAKTRFETGLEAAPGHGPLRSGYGLVLLSVGSLAEAAVQTQKGANLDPLYAAAHSAVGSVVLAQRRYEAAVEAYERGAGLGDLSSLAELPIVYYLDGRDQEALEAWVRFCAVRLQTGDMDKVLREEYESGGLRGATEAVLDAASVHFGTPCMPNPWVGARMLALIGDRDRMFACLEESIEQQRSELLAKVHPIYDPYRDDPRFEAYLRRVHLAE